MSDGSLARKITAAIGTPIATAATAYTVCQPSHCASGGAISTATAVPTLPAPTMPIASPLCCGGNEPDPSDIATPKLAPATPSSTPIASSAPKLCTKKKPSSIAVEIRLISTSVARLRPMYCESTPSGNLNNAPATIGTDSIRPFCAGLRWKVSLMNGAIAPFNTQVQHEKAKYRNAANSVGAWPVRRKFLKWVMAGLDRWMDKQR